MLSKLGSHVRHNVIGYLALFFALTGVAYAAGPLKAGDPAGGDLTGTYPNPTIAANAVGSAEVVEDSLASDDISSQAVGRPELNDGAVVGGPVGTVLDDSLTGDDVNESSLGKVGDADTLDSFDSADYGAVMTGRINGLTSVGAQAGSPSGISTGTADPADVSTITPDHDLRVRDFSVQLTAAPGLGSARTFSVEFAGFNVLGCIISNDATTCQNSGPGNLPISANSEFWIRENPVIGSPAHADARFAFRLTP